MQQAAPGTSASEPSPPPVTPPVIPPATEPSARPTGRRVLVNTGALTAASLWRILVSFVLQLFIARSLGVEGLGHYTIAMAYLNVSQVLSELGLPTLLVRDLAQHPGQRRAALRTMVLLQLAAAFLTWGGLFALSWLPVYEPVTRYALWIVGASLPLFALSSVSQTLFQAGERMELVMGVEVAINLLILGASVAVLATGGGELQLVSVVLFAQAVSAAICLLLLWRSKLLASPQQPGAIAPAALLRKTVPFLGLSLSDVLMQRIDILLLSVVAGVSVTGIYGAAYNLARVMLKLVQSFWKALYPTLSRLLQQSPAHYRRLADLSLRYGLVLVLPAVAASTAVAPELMHLIYGGKWDAAGPVFRWLVWTTPLYLIESYALTLLVIEHHPQISLRLTLLHLGSVVLLLPPLTAAWGANGTAIAVLIAALVGTTAGLWVLRRKQMPLEEIGWWALAAATVIALVTGLYLPAPWLLRMAASLVAFAAVSWATGVLSPSDFTTLRSSLRSSRAG